MGACYTKAEVKAAKAEVAVRKSIPVAPVAVPVVVPVAVPIAVPVAKSLPESVLEPTTQEPTTQEPTNLEDDLEEHIIELDPQRNPYHVYSSTLLGLLLITMVFFVSN